MVREHLANAIQPKRIISAASRRKMALAQKARWARGWEGTEASGGANEFVECEAHHVGISP